ncbi:hypothetical protein ABZ863_21685 [Saccharomonospora sp. NPDC046836]|uniref:hypothetical protein n=1 Tax=Saccharomonospora sp. NPDC046836 TaxID=3156921 RepID=UPI0033CB4B48
MTDETLAEQQPGQDEPTDPPKETPPPEPPTGWDPYAPPPDGWDPYSPPPAPKGWDPYSSPPNGTPQPAPGDAPVPSGGWVSGRAITHLWSASSSPGVWVAVHGVGWKRLSPAAESGHSHVTLLALLAKNYRLPVTYHEDARGQIDQLLV